jgi:hypothetical protein
MLFDLPFNGKRINSEKTVSMNFSAGRIRKVWSIIDKASDRATGLSPSTGSKGSKGSSDGFAPDPSAGERCLLRASLVIAPTGRAPPIAPTN